MDTGLLKKIMIQKGVTAGTLAKETGIFRLILYLKLSGAAEFTLEEIGRIANVLCLTKGQLYLIFFRKNVS